MNATSSEGFVGDAALGIVGTYPPTQCGIATFSRSLRNGIAAAGAGQPRVVRVMSSGDVGPDEVGVVVQWRQGDGRSLAGALSVAADCSAVIVQHEFGIYGGRDGGDVLAFIDRCSVPTIVVLHTALTRPSSHQRQILQRIVDTATVVVQSRSARQRIRSTVDVSGRRLEVIAHGATLNLDGAAARVVDRPTVLTWGLLGPGKGIEHGIDAIAQLGSLVPDPVYVVLGGTHPKVRQREGETYRAALIARALRLGVADRVHFDDRYRDSADLRALVRGADVVLLPYDSREQVTSGVLVEAIASGKPVVATAFPHATEILTNGLGIVVPHGDSRAIADALRVLFLRPHVADAMRAAARVEAHRLAWPVIGARYAQLARDLTPKTLAA